VQRLPARIALFDQGCPEALALGHRGNWPPCVGRCIDACREAPSDLASPMLLVVFNPAGQVATGLSGAGRCSGCGHQARATARTLFHSATLPFPSFFRIVSMIVMEKSNTHSAMSLRGIRQTTSPREKSHISE